MLMLNISLDGQAELAAALLKSGNLPAILDDAFEAIGEHARSAARERAPHDRGKLRNSIIYKQTPRDSQGIPTGVRIGTIGGNPPRYAAWMEYGTGLKNDHPSWPKKKHRLGPKAFDALEAWGNRTGKNWEGAVYLIMTEGGLRPRRYLRSVLAENERKYISTVRMAIRGFKIG